MNAQPFIDEDDEDYGSTTVTTRIAPTDGKYPDRLYFIQNLSQQIVDHFDLAANGYAVVRAHKALGKGWYLMTFQSTKPHHAQLGIHTLKAQISKGRAQVAMPLTHLPSLPKEPKSGVPVEIKILDEGLAFKIPNPYEAPVRVVREINSKADKEEAGFTERSAWSETVQWDTEDALAARRRAILKAKYAD